MWTPTNDDHQPSGRSFAPGWVSAIGICVSIAMLVSPFLVWERVSRTDLGRGIDVYSSLQWSAISDGRGVFIAIVGAGCVLGWILAWGPESSLYGYWLVAAIGALSAIVLALALSVAADPESIWKVTPIAGASGIPYRGGAGLILASVAATVLMAVSLAFLVKPLRQHLTGKDGQASKVDPPG